MTSFRSPTDMRGQGNKKGPLERHIRALQRQSASADVPVGAVLDFAGTTAPDGFLLCEGQDVSRADFASLFAVIGTAHGVGDGSTTFGLPDLRQRFVLGKAASGTGDALGDTGGAIDHVHSQPTHTHTITHTHTTDIGAFNSSGPSLTVAVGTGGGTAAHQSHTHSINPPSTGSGGASDPTSGSDGNDNTGANNPPFYVLNKIIKV